MANSTTGEFDDVDFDSLGGGLGESNYPLDEVFGGANSIGQAKELGARITGLNDVNAGVRYHFFPTWRSQLLNQIWFFISSIGAIWVSKALPAWTVIVGELFTTGSTRYNLHLPILTLVPGFFLSKILIHIYDSVYIIDESGVEAQVGLVSFNLRQPRLRWEDIRGIEPSQNIWERLLNIGTVKIGSAMQEGAEIVMEGIANPKAIQLLVNSERAKRLEELKQSTPAHRQEVVTGD